MNKSHADARLINRRTLGCKAQHHLCANCITLLLASGDKVCAVCKEDFSSLKVSTYSQSPRHKSVLVSEKRIRVDTVVDTCPTECATIDFKAFGETKVSDDGYDVGPVETEETDEHPAVIIDPQHPARFRLKMDFSHLPKSK